MVRIFKVVSFFCALLTYSSEKFNSDKQMIADSESSSTLEDEKYNERIDEHKNEIRNDLKLWHKHLYYEDIKKGTDILEEELKLSVLKVELKKDKYFVDWYHKTKNSLKTRNEADEHKQKDAEERPNVLMYDQLKVHELSKRNLIVKVICGISFVLVFAAVIVYFTSNAHHGEYSNPWFDIKYPNAPLGEHPIGEHSNFSPGEHSNLFHGEHSIGENSNLSRSLGEHSNHSVGDGEYQNSLHGESSDRTSPNISNAVSTNKNNILWRQIFNHVFNKFFQLPFSSAVGESVIINTIKNAGESGESVIVNTIKNAGESGESVIVNAGESVIVKAGESVVAAASNIFMSVFKEIVPYTLAIIVFGLLYAATKNIIGHLKVPKLNSDQNMEKYRMAHEISEKDLNTELPPKHEESAAKPSISSEDQAPFTKELHFLGSYEEIIGSQKEAFLKECTKIIDTFFKTNSVSCTNVRAGSVIIAFGGNKTDTEKVVKWINEKGKLKVGLFEVLYLDTSSPPVPNEKFESDDSKTGTPKWLYAICISVPLLFVILCLGICYMKRTQKKNGTKSVETDLEASSEKDYSIHLHTIKEKVTESEDSTNSWAESIDRSGTFEETDLHSVSPDCNPNINELSKSFGECFTQINLINNILMNEPSDSDEESSERYPWNTNESGDLFHSVEEDFARLDYWFTELLPTLESRTRSKTI